MGRGGSGGPARRAANRPAAARGRQGAAARHPGSPRRRRGSRTRATSRLPSSAPAGAPRAATSKRSACRARCWPQRAAAAAGAHGARRRDRCLLRREGEGLVRTDRLRLLPHRPGAAAPGAGGDRPARDRPVHRGGRRIGRAGAAGQARADRRQAVARQGPGAGSWTLARAQITAAARCRPGRARAGPAGRCRS